jgi:hypothetical protein
VLTKSYSNWRGDKLDSLHSKLEGWKTTGLQVAAQFRAILSYPSHTSHWQATRARTFFLTSPWSARTEATEVSPVGRATPMMMVMTLILDAQACAQARLGLYQEILKTSNFLDGLRSILSDSISKISTCFHETPTCEKVYNPKS